jgi:hypothetical protein
LHGSFGRASHPLSGGLVCVWNRQVAQDDQNLVEDDHPGEAREVLVQRGGQKWVDEVVGLVCWARHAESSQAVSKLLESLVQVWVAYCQLG